jgi:hypothetical protein
VVCVQKGIIESKVSAIESLMEMVVFRGGSWPFSRYELRYWASSQSRWSFRLHKVSERLRQPWVTRLTSGDSALFDNNNVTQAVYLNQLAYGG